MSSDGENPYESYYIGKYTVGESQGQLQLSLSAPPLKELGAAPGDKVLVQRHWSGGVVLTLDEYGLADPNEEIEDFDEEYEASPGVFTEPHDHRVDWCESPQQRGVDLSDIPVCDDLEPTAYRAYKCRSCRDDCINLRESVPSRHKICWSCLKVPDPELPSYDEAVEHQRQLVERREGDHNWADFSTEA